MVLSACATLAAVFAFARSAYAPGDDSKLVDFSQVRHNSPKVVHDAFAHQGIQLRVNSRFSGITMFSRVPVPDADALQVMVGPRTSKASWGPRLERYDERFGNVAVTYGGPDERLLAGVKMAVSTLR